MREPPLLLKLAAVVSSVLLVSGFVCYQSGALPWIGATDNRATNGEEPAPRAAITPPPQPAPSPTDLEAIIMYSSKSMAPLIRPTSPPPAQPGGTAEPTLMGGSKYRAPIFVLPPPGQPTAKPSPAPQTPTP